MFICFMLNLPQKQTVPSSSAKDSWRGVLCLFCYLYFFVTLSLLPLSHTHTYTHTNTHAHIHNNIYLLMSPFLEIFLLFPSFLITNYLFLYKGKTLNDVALSQSHCFEWNFVFIILNCRTQVTKSPTIYKQIFYI